jgi:hypothetical protein
VVLSVCVIGKHKNIYEFNGMTPRVLITLQMVEKKPGCGPCLELRGCPFLQVVGTLVCSYGCCTRDLISSLLAFLCDSRAPNTRHIGGASVEIRTVLLVLAPIWQTSVPILSTPAVLPFLDPNLIFLGLFVKKVLKKLK